MKPCIAIFLTLLALCFITACSGEQGSPGAPGSNGEKGPQGVPGASPVITTYPTAPSQCPSGGLVIAVYPASNGNLGGAQQPAIAVVCNGVQGAPGIPGQNGTLITSVEFCPGQGATTYGHFPEYGLCLNDTLYGVYWDNSNAFLAQIVPGDYQSTSTGLKCNFKVVSGCTIQ